MALIYSTITENASDYAILEKMRIEESETDFDRAFLSILFRGTEAQLRAAFPKGSTSSFHLRNSPGAPANTFKGLMICSGVKVTRARFGFLWATVEWIGMLLPPVSIELSFATGTGATLPLMMAVRGVTKSITTRELNFPIEGASGPINATDPINGAGSKARERTTAITEVHGRDYQLIYIIARSAPVGSPGMVATVGRPFGLTNVFQNATTGLYKEASRANWFDGIKETGGWCCRDFQAASVLILGDLLACRASAKFEWIERYAPQ